MTEKQKKAHEKLERLSNALADEIDALTDEEILAEAQEAGEDVDAIAARSSELIRAVVAEVGRRRLSVARSGYKTHQTVRGSSILAWPLEKKRALIQSLAKGGEFGGKLTFATRKGEDTEADIDSYIEDLIELCVINDEGNEA